MTWENAGLLSNPQLPIFQEKIDFLCHFSRILAHIDSESMDKTAVRPPDRRIEMESIAAWMLNNKHY